MMANYHNDEAINSVLVESLIYRLRNELTEMLTEKLNEEIVKPMVKDAVEKVMKDLEATAARYNNPMMMRDEVQFVLKWRENKHEYTDIKRRI